MGLNIDEWFKIRINNYLLIWSRELGDGFEKGDLDLALAKTNSNDFKILMSHDPSHWEEKGFA